MGKTDVLKFSPRCAPVFILNFSLDTKRYLLQNTKDHGFPFKEKRISGSKLSLCLASEKMKIAAGLPNEKLGIIEIPLLVTPIAPEKYRVLFRLSCF
jgi:hypothetical protein